MRYLCICIFFLLHSTLFAQSLELGIIAGPMAYSGDLSSNQMSTIFNEWQPSAGAFATIKINPVLGIRGSVYRGTISGNDNNRKNTAGRNLHFRSNLTELSLMAQVNIPFSRWLNMNERIESYVLAGGALFHYNPKALYQGEWVELQPLGTEGQNVEAGKSPYKLSQVSIPLGVGLRIPLNENLSLGVEFTPRMTFTDYLDDVSDSYPDIEAIIYGEGGTMVRDLSYRSPEVGGPDEFPSGRARGDNTNLDGYWTGGITLIVKDLSFFGRGGSGSGRVKCPSNF